jgi:hypothetical protein
VRELSEGTDSSFKTKKKKKKEGTDSKIISFYFLF